METLRILLVGDGGREHTLAWKLSQSPHVESIIVVPGNGGTRTCSKVTNNVDVRPNDYPGLVRLATSQKVNLVIPGPEAPLVDGIEEYFRKAGIRCYGCTKEAARMEGSKTFAKNFMKRHNIPTAAYENFSDYEQARQYLDSIDHRIVLKASGLAAGKGVIIPASKDEAHRALKQIMLDKSFGSAGDEIVIEEYLEGDELSILSFCDGYTMRCLPAAQDHKAVFNGDKGPNTGGMGCYSSTSVAAEKLISEVKSTILQPTLDGMRKERYPFVGTLFTGLMLTKNGPMCLEYNVRFGDPETQTLVPLMSNDTDLAEIMVACTEGWLDSVPIKFDNLASATIVAASPGYPGPYPKGLPMQITSPPNGSNLFHAGTALTNGQLQTNGGRVIAAQATSQNLDEAVKQAYAAMEGIKFDNMHFRTDIAHRAFRQGSSTKEALTYASAGVDIDAGNDFVERIKSAVASTRRPGAEAEIGGFGGEVDLRKAGYSNTPVMVGAIDGVGTKLLIAQAMKKHDTVGIDLVAMNANDLVVQGAEPLMFLDYYGCSKLNSEHAAAFVEGVAKGCIEANCALVGGETAEMPGMYQGEDYDSAGAAIGVMDPASRLPRKSSMVVGDVLIGLASNGVHSNGFSLVRRILAREGLPYTAEAPWDRSTTVGLSLLTPTRMYVRSLLKVINPGLVKGLSHITGGGLIDNIPRMLPPHLAAEVDVGVWQLPPVFKWLKQAGNVTAAEMARTFNTGLGMVAVVGKNDVERVSQELEKEGETISIIGNLVERSGEGCLLKNLDMWD